MSIFVSKKLLCRIKRIHMRYNIVLIRRSIFPGISYFKHTVLKVLPGTKQFKLELGFNFISNR